MPLTWGESIFDILPPLILCCCIIRFAEKPQVGETHANASWVLRFSGEVYSQAGHCWPLYASDWYSTRPPAQICLYSNWRPSSPPPWRRWARFSPDFCFTFVEFYIFWSGGALDGKKQVFLTPGVVLGGFPLAEKLR